MKGGGEERSSEASLPPFGTDLLNLKVLRPEILDDLLVGLGGLRDRRPEPVEYTLDRELLHRVCQMGSATRGGITCATTAPFVPPSRRCRREVTAGVSKIVLLSLDWGSFAEIQ